MSIEDRKVLQVIGKAELALAKFLYYYGFFVIGFASFLAKSKLDIYVGVPFGALIVLCGLSLIELLANRGPEC